MATTELNDVAIAEANARDMVRTFHRLQVRTAERKLLNQAIVKVEKEVRRRAAAELPFELTDWAADEFVRDALMVGLKEFVDSIAQGELTTGNVNAS